MSRLGSLFCGNSYHRSLPRNKCKRSDWNNLICFQVLPKVYSAESLSLLRSHPLVSGIKSTTDRSLRLKSDNKTQKVFRL